MKAANMGFVGIFQSTKYIKFNNNSDKMNHFVYCFCFFILKFLTVLFFGNNSHIVVS